MLQKLLIKLFPKDNKENITNKQNPPKKLEEEQIAKDVKKPAALHDSEEDDKKDDSPISETNNFSNVQDGNFASPKVDVSNDDDDEVIDIDNEEELAARGLRKIQIEGEEEEFLMDQEGNIYNLNGEFIGATNEDEGD